MAGSSHMGSVSGVRTRPDERRVRRSIRYFPRGASATRKVAVFLDHTELHPAN
jgi:hypothetical protein